MSNPKTLYDKIWDAHVVHQSEDGTCLLYIDRHLVHEVTSPQAFEGLRMSGRKVRRPDGTLAVADHNVPTTDRSAGIEDAESKLQVDVVCQQRAEFQFQTVAACFARVLLDRKSTVELKDVGLNIIPVNMKDCYIQPNAIIGKSATGTDFIIT